MRMFSALPVHQGEGPWHVNYFRVFITPRNVSPYQKPHLPSGRDLVSLMPTVMNPHTAAVEVDSHNWNNDPTLKFRGVARVRPFALVGTMPAPLPLPLPPKLAPYGISEGLRTLIIPQIHTDSVGLAVKSTHAFTVQTLKREFETPDDQWIRQVMLQDMAGDVHKWLGRLRNAAVPIPGLSLIDPLAEWSRLLVARWLEEARDETDAIERVLKQLADIAVAVNQHHFLAGRRSFCMTTAKALHLTSADALRSGPNAVIGNPVAGLVQTTITDDTWVFETAAVERYSAKVFRYATEYLMGGDAQMLRPVWVEMCTSLAAHFGTKVGDVQVEQIEFSDLDSVQRSELFKGIDQRHVSLIPDKAPT